ncbi:MAG: hypothetical protein A2V88_13255 [Elusimicrobia bacterium RBG_16_66_12]|nr:MAG: hypothetical protein A2V88_13255 [Elusimicrobia bacterium RBG_16_66_12]
MKLILALALLPSFVLPTRANDAEASRQDQPDQAQAVRPDPKLVRLEQELLRKLGEPGLDRKSPQYRRFAEAFRARLDVSMGEVPPTSINKGFHARILSRLDASGMQQAEGSLNAGLEQNPNDHALRLSLGFVRAQKGDYSSAAATAQAVLNSQEVPKPSPQQIAEARSLWYSTKDRSANVGAGETRPRPGTPVVADHRPAI